MDRWLRAVRSDDTQPLLELLSVPEVFEFLCDGAPPERALVEDWVATGSIARLPFGLWLLTDSQDALCGCVRLSEVDDGAASAELTYVLHPSEWGRGLATAMSRSVLARAFEVPSCESVLAGADLPNTRSVAVMARLGMRFHRYVAFPAGRGVEYLLSRADLASSEPSVPFT